jgi:hypothetical protein
MRPWVQTPTPQGEKKQRRKERNISAKIIPCQGKISGIVSSGMSGHTVIDLLFSATLLAVRLQLPQKLQCSSKTIVS